MRNRTGLLLVFVAIFAASAWAQFEGAQKYPRLNFNVAGGYGIGRGDVGSFVGNSFFGVGGAGVNFGRYFGVSGEYMYYDLGIRPNVAKTQDLQTTSGKLNVISLNGIARLPYKLGRYGAYGIFGVGFYDRMVSSTTGMVGVTNPATCQPTWEYWWGISCVRGVTAYPQNLGSFSKIAGGYNFGGGITYDLNRWHKAKVYGEFRYHKAYQSDVQTIVWPISVGLRW